MTALPTAFAFLPSRGVSKEKREQRVKICEAIVGIGFDPETVLLAGERHGQFKVVETHMRNGRYGAFLADEINIKEAKALHRIVLNRKKRAGKTTVHAPRVRPPPSRNQMSATHLFRARKRMRVRDTVRMELSKSYVFKGPRVLKQNYDALLNAFGTMTAAVYDCQGPVKARHAYLLAKVLCDDVQPGKQRLATPTQFVDWFVRQCPHVVAQRGAILGKLEHLLFVVLRCVSYSMR